MAAGSGVVLALAVASAGGLGVAGGSLIVRAVGERARRRSAHDSLEAAQGARRGAIEYAVYLSRALSMGATKPLFGRIGRAPAKRWLDERSHKAGLRDELTAEGLVEAMVRLGLMGMACGAVLGLALSTELAFLLGAVGAVVGGSMPTRAIERLRRERTSGLEGSLSEMLEVVALGLRSGLSFDKSFELYGRHFDTEFARSCKACQRRWVFGLATREEALRDLAASYDSALFCRVVQSMVRSLRFGTSLAEVLEQAASESRAEHRARVEEKVAKAPVKMMLPTAALILPAMLLLVLGPVLLEMMEGF